MSGPGWIKILIEGIIVRHGCSEGQDRHSQHQAGIRLIAAPKVVVVVLNWNGRADTAECLESLKLVKYPNLEVIVVDNGSTDGSVEVFRKDYPTIDIIETGRNLGYSGGNNAGIHRALDRGADFTLILNNDAVVSPSLIEDLTAAAGANPEIGVCGPTVYDYGTEARVQATGGMIDWNRGQLRGMPPGGPEPSSAGRTIDVDIVHGCCLLVRKEVVKAIGGFDQGFFSHWDEIDYCVRAKRAGFRVVWAENSKVWHKKGAARAKVSGFSEYFNSRNRILFMRKHASRSQLFRFVMYYFAFEFWQIEAFYMRRFKDVRRCTSQLRGSIDGLLGRTGPGPWA